MRRSLGVVWQWSETQMSNDTVITPNNPEKYQLSFSEDGSVVGVIDCNHAFGSYTTDGNHHHHDAGDHAHVLRRRFAGHGLRAAIWPQVTSFVIRDGQLALALPMDAGIVIFDPVVPQ